MSNPYAESGIQIVFLEITETEFLGRSSNLEFPGRRAMSKGGSGHKTFKADVFHFLRTLWREKLNA